MAWVKPLDYDLNINDTKDIELVDPKATYFGTYDEAKARIELEINLPQLVRRGRKRIEKIIKNPKSSSSPLMIT